MKYLPIRGKGDVGASQVQAFGSIMQVSGRSDVPLQGEDGVAGIDQSGSRKLPSDVWVVVSELPQCIFVDRKESLRSRLFKSRVANTRILLSSAECTYGLSSFKLRSDAHAHSPVYEDTTPSGKARPRAAKIGNRVTHVALVNHKAKKKAGNC